MLKYGYHIFLRLKGQNMRVYTIGDNKFPCSKSMFIGQGYDALTMDIAGNVLWYNHTLRRLSKKLLSKHAFYEIDCTFMDLKGKIDNLTKEKC